MAICSADCTKLPPRPVKEGCGIDTRPGGINRLVFASCRTQFDNILDLSEWCEKVTQGEIVVTNPISGQKPKGSFTKKRISSCQPESVTGVERSITFQDFGADDVAFTDFSFWNAILKDTSLYQVGWLTCDGLFFGFVNQFTLEVDHVIEDTNLGSSFWDGSLMWTGFEHIEPVYVPGLLGVLQGNCGQVPNFSICETPIVSPAGPLTLCSVEGFNLSTPFVLHATYQWFNGGTPIPGATGREINVLTPGSYTVQLTIPGCGAALTSTAVTVNPNVVEVPTASFVDNGFSGWNITFTAPLGPQYEYAIISEVNGEMVQTDWSTSTAWTNVFNGSPVTLLVRDRITGCVNSAVGQ